MRNKAILHVSTVSKLYYIFTAMKADSYKDCCYHNILHLSKEKVIFVCRNKGEAMWAVGSLAFLLVGLILAVCYTQLWRKGNHGESFEKSRLWNDESQPGSVSVAGWCYEILRLVSRMGIIKYG